MMRAALAMVLLPLAGACERDGLAPDSLDVPPAPRCGDGLENDDAPCLRSDTATITSGYDFIRRADFDGDGDRELFSITQSIDVSWPLLFTGSVDSGAIEFQTYFEIDKYAIYRPEVLDFDGDGRTDLVGAAEFWFWQADIYTFDIRLGTWRNRGDFQFEAVFEWISGFYPVLVPGDIDGDGRTDLLGIPRSDLAFVWTYDPQTDGLRTAAELDLSPLALLGDPQLVATDLDGDNHADFVLTDASGRVWSIHGGPEFQLTVHDPQPPVALAPDSQALVARDFDGDGRVDLAAVHIPFPNFKESVHTVSLALGRANGGFAPLASFAAAHPLTAKTMEPWNDAPQIAHLGLFDLDGSGQLALVYAHKQRPELVIHPRVAETRGEQPVIVPLDFPADSLFVDDFEDDGEDAIYVITNYTIKVEPNKEYPDGRVSTHYIVRFSPDP